MRPLHPIGIGTWVVSLMVGHALFAHSVPHRVSRAVARQTVYIDRFRRQSARENHRIEKETKQLFASVPVTHPDTLYERQYDTLPAYFQGETGFDTYCVWYADHLAALNRNQVSRTERDTLYDIFYQLNGLWQEISGNGTLFLHNAYRIPAYAEYYLYTYHHLSDNGLSDNGLSDNGLSDNGLSTRGTIREAERQQTFAILRSLLARYRNEERPELSPGSFSTVEPRLTSLRALLTNRQYLHCLRAYLLWWEEREGKIIEITE